MDSGAALRIEGLSGETEWKKEGEKQGLILMASQHCLCQTWGAPVLLFYLGRGVFFPPSTFKLYISLQVNKLCRQVPTNREGPPSPWAPKEMNLEFYVLTWRASQRSSPEGLGWVAGCYTIV